MREIKASDKVTGARRIASIEAARRKVKDGELYFIRRHGRCFGMGRGKNVPAAQFHRVWFSRVKRVKAGQNGSNGSKGPCDAKSVRQLPRSSVVLALILCIS